MSASPRELHFTTSNRSNNRVQLSWDEHRVDLLTEQEANRVVGLVMMNRFNPEEWGHRYSRTIVPFRPKEKVL